MLRKKVRLGFTVPVKEISGDIKDTDLLLAMGELPSQ
jgi:hypothetical protein